MSCVGPMNKRILAIISAYSFFVSGCGTTQHLVPPMPLPKGQFEGRICIGYTTSGFGQFSAYMTGYAGIDNYNTLGFTLSGFIFPSSLSYIRYWPSASGSSTLQLHYNDLMGSTFNPTMELDYGFSASSAGNFHSGTVGFGFYTTPLLRYLLGQKVWQTDFVPIFGYQLRTGSMALEADMIYGQSKYFVRYYKASMGYLADTNRTEDGRAHPITIAHSSVTRIIEIDPREIIAPGWIIEIDTIQSLVIASRDPYVDCMVCGWRTHQLSAYPASKMHKVYWVWKSQRGQEYSPQILSPMTMELNMDQVLRNYENGGDITLLTDADIVEQTLENVSSGLDDISFSISWKGRNK